MLAEAKVELELLHHFQQGSMEAFEALFRDYQRAVFGWIIRIVRDPAAAEELTIETFWRVYRAHARFDPGKGFGAWARRIATHAALDWLRTRRPENEMPANYFAELPDPRSDDACVADEIRRKTAQAFAKLSPKLRVVATLVVIEECSHKEVAKALGISETAVNLRVFRALRRLRKDLEGQGIRP